MIFPSLAILIPIYKEKEGLLRQNYEIFSRLNYPGKLQVYWLLHESDRKTLEKAMKVNLGFKFRILFDNLNPLLKANALNNTLEEVREEVVTVFDVDSVVTSDFIKEGIYLLVNNSQFVLTQGQPLPYNANVNWLTRWQKMIYESYFFFQKICWSDTDGWFPLHGTGYFIRKRDLEKIGGWSPMLTEDIDLGTRLHAQGMKMFPFEKPVYYEECPETLLNLMRQQARWRKGWVQHGLKHDLKRNHPRIWAFMSELKWSAFTHSFACLVVALNLLTLASSPLISTLNLALISLCFVVLPYHVNRKHYPNLSKSYGLLNMARWTLYGVLSLKGWIELKVGYRPLGWYHTKKKGISNLMDFLRRLIGK